jgi:hypothetical protein
MPYYYTIPNERLRMLVMASESIHSMREDDVQKMITQIAALDEDSQDAMIETLEDEQRQIAAAKRARGITPEMELAQINKDMAKLSAIEHEFEMAIAKESARADREESEKKAEEIIKDVSAP